MTNDERPFGRVLYDELKRLGGGVTSQLKYADIQILKEASREETLQLFHGSGYAILQRIKEDTPEQVADYLTRHLAAAQRTANIMLGGTFLGAV